MMQVPTGERIDQALHRVYTRPELQPREPGAMDAFNEWRRDMLIRMGEWLSRFGGLRGDNPVVYWLVIGVLAAAGVSILVFLLWNTMARLEERGPAPQPVTQGGRVNARARTAAEWEEAARRAAAEGRFREAAVALYQALLLRLEASGVVRYDPAKTPGDYRREARRNPQAAGALATFLRGFEPVVFGGRALDAAGYDRLRGAVGEAGARG